MDLSDTLKDIKKKAEDAAHEHKDEIHQAVQKATEAADVRTQGRYSDKIAKAGEIADSYVERLTTPAEPREPAPEPGPQPPAPAST